MLSVHRNPVIVSWDREAGFYLVSTFWHDITSVKTKESILELIDGLSQEEVSVGIDTSTSSLVAASTRTGAFSGATREAEEKIIQAWVAKHGCTVLPKKTAWGLVPELDEARKEARAARNAPKMPVDPNLIASLLENL